MNERILHPFRGSDPGESIGIKSQAVHESCRKQPVYSCGDDLTLQVATKHWLAVQHGLRYLQRTIEVVLTFNGCGNESVADVYSDADIANGVSLKSVFAMVLRMYGNCVFY